jgi:outer membrane protein TolC
MRFVRSFAVGGLVVLIGAGGTAAAGQAPGAAPSAPLTLKDAIALARENSQTLRTAQAEAQVAKEDRVQARAGLLPSLSGLGQYIHTQPNGTPSGVFVANDGPDVYNVWGTIHADLFSPSKWADYRAATAAEVVARAQADVAVRGLVSTVVENFYTLVAAVRKTASARQGLSEAQQFLQVTERQEAGGEVAHSDVVKAQIEVGQRERDVQDAELTELKSRLGVSVVVFPDFRDNFTVVDDLTDGPPLLPLETVRTMASDNSPDLKAAQAALRQQSSNVTAAKSEYLPSVSFDYFYGINANDFATYNAENQRLLGSAWQTQVTVPLWNWGATQSKVRQAQIRQGEAKAELSLVQRQLLANLSMFYAEARTSSLQVDSLKASLDLATESLRLTLLRYQAGEVSVLEVVDAQTTLIQARNAYDDGLVRYRVALAALQTLTGTL